MMTYPNQTKWDYRFLGMARLIASWSKDPSTKCGAVIVRPDRTVASLGYNGFPRKTDDGLDVYEDRELKYARVVHAEMNAVLHAREPLQGYTLYTYPAGTGPTCDRCAAHVIQTGIRRVVGLRGETDFGDRWREANARAMDLYREAGVMVEMLTMDGMP